MTIAHRMPDVGHTPDSPERSQVMGRVVANPVAIASVAAAATKLWIEQLRLLPHMTQVASTRS